MQYTDSVTRPAAAHRPATLIPAFFGSMLFTHDSSRYLPFDAESTAILHELVSTPFAAVHARWARDRDAESVAALEAFFEGLGDLGLCTLDGRLAAGILPVPQQFGSPATPAEGLAPPADHLLGPLAVHLLTWRYRRSGSHADANMRDRPMTRSRRSILPGGGREHWHSGAYRSQMAARMKSWAMRGGQNRLEAHLQRTSSMVTPIRISSALLMLRSRPRTLSSSPPPIAGAPQLSPCLLRRRSCARYRPHARHGLASGRRR
jgi:hypothetical protein